MQTAYPMKEYDAVVVGGGFAGLIAAVKLARANRKVILLERSNQLGGRGMTHEKNGALFNLGAHALYRDGEANAMLRELGVSIEGSVPPTNGYGIWQGRLAPLPVTPWLLLRSRLLSGSGKLELGRFMGRLHRYDPAAIPKMSLREWAEREIRDPMVRHFFYALSRTGTYNKEVSRQLAGPALLQVQRSMKGSVLYVHGGWQRLVDQLHELAVRAGATVRTGAAIANIIREDGRVSGVRLHDGETLSARTVISTLSPAGTHRLVQDAELPSLERWKNEARPIMAAGLDLALKRLPIPDRHFAIGLDQPVYFSHHTSVARLSDEGHRVVHLLKYNGAGESDPRADERLLEETMTLIHPGWRNEVVARLYLPNIAVSHDYMHLDRTGPLPGPRVPELPGFYVAGDWTTHGEMLVDAAAASADRAARQVLEDLRPHTRAAATETA
ncbi:NAD(P)/FAD-dependent oxidoreductase [Cohnella sp. REN36]|uniref:phytoene desaturase family protein n=1 Tax=Cohnella sp. REN36 TaxID=2887347 RepID=UPI001D134229|nr:NAD(P)/FAD-dependent oxidoreductase [Cohnella sp. REN36]MCC3376061.1 NAD(P)/FAD-dependent oxidoreductase [Cohnella sp. REN36]